MKAILTFNFLFLAVAALAQDNKNDTNSLDSAFRTYDVRICRKWSIYTNSSQHNLYHFADTTKYKLIEIYSLDNDCLDTSSIMFSCNESRKMVEDLNKLNGLIGEYITIIGNNWFKYELKEDNKKQNIHQGIINHNELKVSAKLSLFLIEREKTFLFIAPNKDVLYVYATEKKDNSSFPFLDKKYVTEIFNLTAKQFRSKLIICK